MDVFTIKSSTRIGSSSSTSRTRRRTEEMLRIKPARESYDFTSLDARISRCEGDDGDKGRLSTASARKCRYFVPSLTSYEVAVLSVNIPDLAEFPYGGNHNHLCPLTI